MVAHAKRSNGFINGASSKVKVMENTLLVSCKITFTYLLLQHLIIYTYTLRKIYLINFFRLHEIQNTWNCNFNFTDLQVTEKEIHLWQELLFDSLINDHKHIYDPVITLQRCVEFCVLCNHYFLRREHPLAGICSVLNPLSVS